jgi:GT2 family glycosyltransferase
MNNSVDIIIPTINRSDDILECLDSILVQTVQPRSIILIDASDDEKLSDIIEKKYQQLPIQYFRAEKGLPHQRNVGLEYSNAEWILFLDDDIALESSFIENALKCMEKHLDFAALTGRVINHGRKKKVNPLLILFQRMFYLSESKVAGFKSSGDYNVNHPSINKPVEVGIAVGCLSMYRRDIFDNFRFDTNFQFLEGYASLEDEDFSLQLKHKHKILYCPEAEAYHNRDLGKGTRLSEWKRGRIRAFNYRYIYRKHRAYYNFKSFPHFLSCIGMILETLLNKRSLTLAKGMLNGFRLYRKKKNLLEESVSYNFTPK